MILRDGVSSQPQQLGLQHSALPNGVDRIVGRMRIDGRSETRAGIRARERSPGEKLGSRNEGGLARAVHR